MDKMNELKLLKKNNNKKTDLIDQEKFQINIDI